MTCRVYVDWAHICRHWERHRYPTHIKAGSKNINKCMHGLFKKRLYEVSYALRGDITKKDGTLSLCQMAYAEVFWRKDVDWTTFLAKKRNGKFSSKVRRILPNPGVPLEFVDEDNHVQRHAGPNMEMMEQDSAGGEVPDMEGV